MDGVYTSMSQHGSVGIFRREKIVQKYLSRVIRCEHEMLCPYCCWDWTGTKVPFGYGMLGYYSPVKPRFRTISIHRLSWEIHNKREIPGNLHCLHRCHNPSCSNPLHLYLGTAKDNAIDAVRAGHHWTAIYPEKVKEHMIHMREKRTRKRG